MDEKIHTNFKRVRVMSMQSFPLLISIRRQVADG